VAVFLFFFQAEDGIRDLIVTGVQTCALPIFGPYVSEGTFEFRVGDEIATLADGIAREGPAEDPDVVVTAKPEGMYYLLIEHRLEGVKVEGNYQLLERLVSAMAPAEPVAVSA